MWYVSLIYIHDVQESSLKSKRCLCFFYFINLLCQSYMQCICNSEARFLFFLRKLTAMSKIVSIPVLFLMRKNINDKCYVSELIGGTTVFATLCRTCIRAVLSYFCCF